MEGVRGFNFEALAHFFCCHFRVSDVWKINPRQGRTEAWTLMSEHGAVGVKPRTVGLEVGSVLQPDGKTIETLRFRMDGDPIAQAVRCGLGNGNTPLCRFLGEPKGDLQHVCLLSVVTRNVWCSLPIRLAVRFPFYHVGDEGRREALDRMEMEAGAVPGPYMEFGATPKEGQDVERRPVDEDLRYGFLNRFFVATMALVNEGNLCNGVVPIPYEACVRAGLPVFRGPPPPPSEFDGDVETWNTHWMEATKAEHRIAMFYAIPVNHVLAWGFRNEAYAARKKLPSLRFQFVPPPAAGMGEDPVLLYYLVADLHYDFVVQEVKRFWLRKVDMRPLSALSFELYPLCARSRYPPDLVPAEVQMVGGVAALRSYLTYMAPDVGAVSDALIPQLIPTLCPGFPETDGFLPYAPEELHALDMASNASDLAGLRRKK